jgi:hypothetical protein
MGIELVVLYSIYAIAGSIFGATAVGVAENITVTMVKANADKYVACQENAKNDAASCKGLE